METVWGGDLYSQLKREKVKTTKSIQNSISYGKGYSYNWEEHIGLEELEANNLLHEMFHFPNHTEPISS